MTLEGTKPSADLSRAEDAIAKMAAAYPDVLESNPWGHRAFKVRGKTFLFLGADASGLSFSLKLPDSGPEVLKLPNAEPTHYGLGKSGWVSLSFTAGQKVPLPRVKQWLEESFTAIAPKKRAAKATTKQAASQPVGRAPKRASKSSERSKRSTATSAQKPAKPARRAAKSPRAKASKRLSAR